MFESLMLALVTVFIGILPLLITKRLGMASLLGVLGFFLLWWIYYSDTPGFIYPFFGTASVCLLFMWAICTAIGTFTDCPPGTASISGGFIAILLLLMFISAVSGNGCFSSGRYERLLGDVQQREWTKDIQPKDPKHVRLVPHELAYYLATKQLGEVKGAIGSQFQINKEYLTLQLIKGELWYVAPLDYNGFSIWTSADCAPGYVMVHGEDPKMQVVVKADCKFRYMPNAFFGDNLKRHIWKQSMGNYGLTEFSFEIDDSGNQWWVVAAFKPTIMWWGEKVFGVYIVNPTTGDTKFYPIGEVPSWVDRVVPKDYVKSYVGLHGLYAGGWLNSWWGKKDLIEPEEPTLVYGSDAKPYWVTCVTSPNDADASLVGLIYTDTQTGKSIEYHAVGGTEEAAMKLVDNKVSFRKLHGSSPVLYNIYGVMTSIIPLLGESHSYQGVAMVDVANMQLTVGDDIESAARQYQKLVMSGSGQKLSPEKIYNLQKTTGTVDRVTSELSGGETIYYIHVQDCTHIFSGGSDLSPKLRMTEKGDQVVIGFIESEEDILPISNFDLPKLVLTQSSDQEQLGQRVAERQEQVKVREDSHNARGEVSNMSDTELQALIKLKKKSGK